jgi:3-oxoacyl-[acyl-carrier protein] reductase
MARSGRIALVTGAATGIGRAIAERLAQDGARVIVNYRRSSAAARDAADVIAAGGGNAELFQADLSRVEEIRRLFHEVMRRHGRLDVIVTNAGQYLRKPIDQVTEQDFDTLFALNARGTFFALQEAARHVADGGRIVHISTGATALQSPQEIALYCASKVPAEQIVRSLARVLGPRGVTVNTVSPGFTATDMLPDDPGFREAAAQMSPLGRIGTPADIAEVVAYLASEAGGWLTGQNIQAGGGIV